MSKNKFLYSHNSQNSKILFVKSILQSKKTNLTHTIIHSSHPIPSHPIPCEKSQANGLLGQPSIQLPAVPACLPFIHSFILSERVNGWNSFVVFVYIYQTTAIHNNTPIFHSQPLPSISLSSHLLSFYFNYSLLPRNKRETRIMEAMKKMNVVLVAVVMMLMASSAVRNVAAMEAPAQAPAPASDAAAFVPTVFASLAALVMGMLF